MSARHATEKQSSSAKANIHEVNSVIENLYTIIDTIGIIALDKFTLRYLVQLIELGIPAHHLVELLIECANEVENMKALEAYSNKNNKN